MITINLSTAENQRHIHVATTELQGHTYSARSKSKSPIHKLARTLVAAGFDPATPITIFRGNTPVLRNPVPLSQWVSKDVVDDDNRGLRTVPYRAYLRDAIAA